MLTRMLNRKRIVIVALALLLYTQAAHAQTTAFTYQGKLSDSGNPASGTYDMQFKLFDALTDGTQVGAIITNTSVAVAAGIFTVELDFAAGAFDGTARFLEICVRPAGSPDPYTVLSPRQPFTSTPYALHSANASAADGLSAACVACVSDSHIATVDGAKVTGSVAGSQISGEIPTASVPIGSGNYIQNSAAALRAGKTSLQQAAGFNIDGSGIIGDSLGIGIAPRSGIKLDIVGNVVINPGNGSAMQFGTPNTETGMSTLVGNGRADMRFDGTTLKLVAGSVGGPPPATNGIVISNAGNVGIGTTFPSPLFKLSVVGSSAITGGLTIGDVTPVSRGLTVGGGDVNIENSATMNALTVFNGASLGGNVSVGINLAVSRSVFIGFVGLGGNESICRNSATGAIASCSSSLRYKSGVETYGQGFDFLNRLRPISFTWKQNGQRDIGFGAEDVAKINPLFVTYNAKGEVEGVKYDRLSVIFVNAFKEQQKQIEQLQLQIENMKKLICLDHPNADICQRT